MRMRFPYIQSPCKDCPDRYLGCHSHCEKFKVYEEDKSKMQYELRKQANKENGIIAYEVQRAKRIRERTKRH